MRWIFKRNKGHIGLEILSEHIDGRLLSAEAENVERHLGSCLQCREEFESLQYTVGLLNRVPEVSPRRIFTLDIAPEPAPVPIARGFRVPAWSYGVAASVAVMLFVAVLSADLTGSLEGTPRTLDDSTLASGAQSEPTEGAQQAITAPLPGPVEDAAPAVSDEDQSETEAAKSQEGAVAEAPSDGAFAESAAGPTPARDTPAISDAEEAPVSESPAPLPAEPTTPLKAFGDAATGQEGTSAPTGVTSAPGAAAAETAPAEPTPVPLTLTTPISAPTSKPVVTQEYAVETAITAGSDAEEDGTSRGPEAPSDAVAATTPELISGSTATFWRVLEGVPAGVAVLLLGWFFLRVLPARRRSL